MSSDRESFEPAEVDFTIKRIKKTAELTGALLDYWVARAEGYEWADDVAPIRAVGVPMYSASWSDGGPLIERERISVEFLNLRDEAFWQASMLTPQGVAESGPTPLIAAMRAYVASKFGHDVPDDVAA